MTCKHCVHAVTGELKNLGATYGPPSACPASQR
jgi:copper chaperone CopZ